MWLQEIYHIYHIFKAPIFPYTCLPVKPLSLSLAPWIMLPQAKLHVVVQKERSVKFVALARVS